MITSLAPVIVHSLLEHLSQEPDPERKPGKKPQLDRRPQNGMSQTWSHYRYLPLAIHHTEIGRFCRAQGQGWAWTHGWISNKPALTRHINKGIIYRVYNREEVKRSPEQKITIPTLLLLPTLHPLHENLPYLLPWYLRDVYFACCQEFLQKHEQVTWILW